MSESPPHIDSYDFGRITIDGEAYGRDVIISPDGVKRDWWRKEGHSLCPEDLGPVLEANPGVVIIGCGASGLLSVPEETRRWLADKGIDLIDLPTRAACERYNELSGEEGARVVAGLHLTC